MEDVQKPSSVFQKIQSFWLGEKKSDLKKKKKKCKLWESKDNAIIIIILFFF